MISYLLISIFGYLTFLDNTEEDLILSYPGDSNILNVIRIIMAVSIILTYPMANFPCRFSLDNLLFPSKTEPPAWMTITCGNFKNLTGRKLAKLAIAYPRWRTFAEALVITSLAYVLSILFPKISIVFGLTGSTASTFTSYLLPSWFYLMLSTPQVFTYVLDNEKRGSGGRKYVIAVRNDRSWKESFSYIFTDWRVNRHKPFAALLLVAGIVFGVLGTTLIIIGWF